MIMKKFATKSIFFFILVLLSVSCKYDKLLKSSNYKLKYEKALAYYEQEEYVKAQGLLEQLNPVLKATDRADTILYYLANSYFEQENFILADHHYSQFYETFGNHHWAEEAEFKSAYCNYELSPRPALDQDYTKKAISKLNLFITRHPRHSKVRECHRLINELKDKLAIKAYRAAKLYYDMEDYMAATVALENCLKRFPNTSHRKEIKFFVLKSKFLLAANSVKSKEEERFQEALDAYYTFTSEYPESEFSREVNQIFEKTQRNLMN